MSTEEVVEMAEVIPIKNGYGLKALLFVGGAAIGAGVTYFVVKKKIYAEAEAKFDLELQESMEFLVKKMGIDKMIVTDEDPDDLAPEEEIETPAEAEDDSLGVFSGERIIEEKPPLEDLAKRNQTTNYNAISTPEDFTSGPEEDLSPPEPEYDNPDISVISRDLWDDNTSGYPQTTITYFSDGGVLDIGGDWLVDHESFIGHGKPPFGQMSEDANVVYLRNKKLQTEYEVIYDQGKASDFAEVMDSTDMPAGSDELKHSLDQLQRKFNGDRNP